MEITKQTVDRLASLAKLSFSEEEKERIIPELSHILTYMEKTGEGVEPADSSANTSCLNKVSSANGCLREDVPVPSFDREELLKNAKQRTDTTTVVPKTVEV